MYMSSRYSFPWGRHDIFWIKMAARLLFIIIIIIIIIIIKERFNVAFSK